MNRMTFEMLAKYIAGKNKVNITFDAQATGASANVKTNTINLPCDLKDQNILGALALLMHEGAHLKHSTILPDDLAPTVITHNILNAIEDIRIDQKNFRLLPNVQDFYRSLLDQFVYSKEDELIKEGIMTRCLINSILYHEGFNMITEDTEAMEFIKKNHVRQVVGQAIYNIEAQDWRAVKKDIQQIMDIFKIKPEDDMPMPVTIQIGVGIPNPGGKDAKGDEEGEAKGGMAKDVGDTNKYLNPGSAWDKGEGIKGASRNILGSTAFQDQTKQAFAELLNVKEKKAVYEGVELNTNSLTDFFTGEVDELFVDRDVIKAKKSKISFCLDGSGSMQTNLIDGKWRSTVLVKTVRSIIEQLKEVQAMEGLNVRWDIWAFDYNARKLNPDRWEAEYTTAGGGTNLRDSFRTVEEDILKDYEIDGNRMIVLVTDGEVGSGEVEELRADIIKHGATVKCMILGIGANMTGSFVKDVVGDNNILAEEHADAIVMDAIKVMLD